MTISIIMLCLFFCVMIGVGIWGMKKTSNLNDFFLGGRNVGVWVSAFAYGTSYFSAVLFIGFSGKFGWGFGLNVLWIVFGNVIFGTLLAWLVLGRRTRRMSQNLDVMTMPEFLQERFGGKHFKTFAAIIIFVFLLPYSASVFKGLGHLFENNFNISYDMALLVMIIITGIYLVLGGYLSITLNDFIQGLIMLVGSGFMVAYLVKGANVSGNIFTQITTAYHSHVPLENRPSNLMLFCIVFMTSFGTWGLPQMIQKFYAIKSEKLITKTAFATTFIALIIVFAAYFTGALSHLYFDSVPMSDGKPAFDEIIPLLLKAHLPEFLMSIILLLVLSASMSTLSSLVLVSSSAIAIDLYKGHARPSESKDHSLLMMRFLSAVFIVLSFFIAKYKFSFIVTLMSLSWGAVAGSFMAPYVYALYWKRTTKIGAFSGMATGLTLAIVLFFALGTKNSPIASTIAMIVPFIVVPIVSLLTTPPDQKIIDIAFSGIEKKK